MNIQKQIKQDLTAAIKAKDANKKDALRVIMGEFGRLDKKKLSDGEAIKIMKKLMKSEKEVLEKKGDETDGIVLIVHCLKPSQLFSKLLSSNTWSNMYMYILYIYEYSEKHLCLQVPPFHIHPTIFDTYDVGKNDENPKSSNSTNYKGVQVNHRYGSNAV